MRRLIAPVAGLALVAILGIAGGANSSHAQGTATVNVGGNDALGSFLVGPNGNTLYIFTQDSPGESNCHDQCEANWPPLTVGAGETPTKAAGIEGTLGVHERPDGSQQVTLNGQPLYYWAADTEPGQATGQGVGGVWFVVEAQASTQATPAGGSSNTPSAPQSGMGLQASGGALVPAWMYLALAGALLAFAGSTAYLFAKR